VAHAYNPNYLGDGYWGDGSLRPASAKKEKKKEREREREREREILASGVSHLGSGSTAYCLDRLLKPHL
jgi:hypothetical protein